MHLISTRIIIILMVKSQDPISSGALMVQSIGSQRPTKESENAWYLIEAQDYSEKLGEYLLQKHGRRESYS